MKPGQQNANPNRDYMIGRQPIFSRNQTVIGYELLFRSPTESPASVDGDRATTEVILNTFAEVGLENLVGNARAFINLTRAFINGDLPLPFQPNQTVLEVLENVQLDREMVARIQILARKGYTIALDDVTSFERIRPLIGLAKIVKVDYPFVNRAELPWMVQKIHENGLLALSEKVETQAEYAYCKSIGFDFFQGYFFAKPAIIRGNRIDSSRMIILHALALLQNPNINFQMLEDVIQRDVTLSYKLLKLTNSAFYSQQAKVASISQTISLIGITQLSGWLTLMMMSTSENKPHELTTSALLRAKLCELIGKRTGFSDTNMLFMVGLFSVLDALFDIPMEKLLSSLPISNDIQTTLLTHQGKSGAILNLVLTLETGQFANADLLGLTPDAVRDIYLQAVRWTHELITKTEATLQAAK